MSDSFQIPWTVAHHAPLSMGFPRQEYWSGLPFPSSEDLPEPGIKPMSPALAGRFFTTEPPGKTGTNIGAEPGVPRVNFQGQTYSDISHSPHLHPLPGPVPSLSPRLAASESLLWYNSLGPWDPGPEPVSRFLCSPRSLELVLREEGKQSFPLTLPLPGCGP